ncbi:hypothetical protein PPTG_21134 [Phytophthora nicotianae INRA-310]|uniref:Uncharacterized protein n=1 Tax=Phytophthora nicotianae (strain INRA-310) TaxID=761204 RepID=W2R8Q8_PHYN3|nr:hypothetical protein PPTG_21134 [Phytophthora nicotianae INRA-310]ETN21767.1 hypothetical protein PPTG_21134 [Phytophthora nicotianae INRA-310]
MKTVVEMMDKYPVQLEDAYLRSKAIECRWEAIRPVTYMHPFMIPVGLTRSMEAAIETARAEQKEPDALDEGLSSKASH